MAITNFIPEVWTAQLLSSLKKATVFGGPSVVNRSYEGQIAGGGDTVRITSISRPTIAAYTKNVTAITPETLTDAERSLVIDQSYYFAFEVDDIDMRQSASGGALLAEAANEAAYGLADTADQFLMTTILAGVPAGNKIGATAITTQSLAQTGVLGLKTKLDAADVPSQGRYIVAPPWFVNMLLNGSALASVANAGTDAGLRNGQVGRLFGFDLLMSNNIAAGYNSQADDYAVIAGVASAVTFAEQINKVEAYRPESAFSDAIKGLHLYGAKVVRPTALATLQASVS